MMAYGHNVMQEATSIYMITQINKNHIRSTALKRTAINYEGGGDFLRVKDFYSSMHQNSQHINQDLTLR